MTCIVGIERDGILWIGADSAAFKDDEINIRTDPKVWRAGEFLYGFSGSFRVGQVLRWGFKPPRNTRGTDMEYMVMDFVDDLKDFLSDKGLLVRGDSFDSYDAEIVIGFRSRFYVIESDFNVSAKADPYIASGSGAHYALGALYALFEQESLSPEQILHQALGASSYFCPSVKPPLSIISNKD